MNVRGWSTPRWEQRQDEMEEMGEKKRFRNVYVVKPGPYDLSSIKPQCEHIIYGTDGYADDVMGMYRQLQESLEDFDADKDLLIAVGSANACALATTIIVQKIVQSGKKNWDSYCLAVYNNRTYLFWRVPVLGAVTEPYQFGNGTEVG